jgi:hypothetical protein
MSAADAVWAMASGYPRGVREHRLSMVLQAVIDDSGGLSETINPVFVLAGFLADTSAWAALSDEWQAILDDSPKLAYFKMVEANGLRGPFARTLGWNESLRDSRLRRFVETIKKNVFLRLSVSIDKHAFISIFHSSSFSKRSHNTDKPYCLAFQLLLTMVSASQIERQDLFGPTPRPVDFIFDEQGNIGTEAQSTWLDFKRSCERSAQQGKTDFRPFLGSIPIFRDEKDFLPLQAADLYAWQVRRIFFDSNPQWVKLLNELSKIPQVSKHMAQSDLEKFMFGGERVPRRGGPQ